MFLSSALRANNIQISNFSLNGQNTAAGPDSSANFIYVNLNLSWENSWRWNSVNQGLSYISVLQAGSGYTSAPSVIFSGGGGTGASATAVINGGSVSQIVINNPGSGYTSPPVISLSGGGGTAALAQAYFQSWWDAAWVFVKFRLNGGEWQHAYLSDTGHVAPAGVTIAGGLRYPGQAFARSSNPAMGVFVYRTSAGSGDNTFNNIGLRWNYGAQGVSDLAFVEVQLHAIEMVHVPQGAFQVGDSTVTATTGQLCAGLSDNPFTISSENALTLGGGGAGSLGNHNGANVNPTEDFSDASSRTLPAAFPKGFNAFYSMKYEISQAHYARFLNTLTLTQQTQRTFNSPTDVAGTGALISGNSWRNGIDIMTPGLSGSSTPATYGCNLNGTAPAWQSNDGEWLACNYLSWMDVAAYLDWAALRPLTELEFEKMCRGSAKPVTGEFAWGSNTATSLSSFTNGAFITESSGTAGANLVISPTTGPARVGIFATDSSSVRSSASASYWGIMDLSGNVTERAVAIGTSVGRTFTGVHGDGLLSSGGNAQEANWPGTGTGGDVNGATGTGFRGGPIGPAINRCQVSYRQYMNDNSTFREVSYGGRGVRTAP